MEKNNDILYCEKCGKELIRLPFLYLTDPPKYPYRCPDCNYEKADTLLHGNKEWDKSMKKECNNL